MISFKHKGDFKSTQKFLDKIKRKKQYDMLEHYAQQGVDALAAATPKDTGLTAASWSYEIIRGDDSIQIIWKNSNNSDGIPIVVLLQYGHATRQGGYVKGQDFINPAIKPIFDQILINVWKEVTS